MLYCYQPLLFYRSPMKQRILSLTLLFFLAVVSAPALPPPDKSMSGNTDVQISKETTELILGGQSAEAKMRVVRRIRKLPSSDIPAPMAEKGQMGKHKIIMVMVEFSDRSFPATHSKAYYQNTLFSESGYTMKTYYKENSYGKFDIEGKVYGVYKINKPVSYFHYKPGMNSNLNRMKELTQLIVQAASKDINFKEYDVYNSKGERKSDGFVDHFGIVFPGSFDDIWPHRWGGLTLASDDGVIVNGYFLQNTASPVGTFIHEFGHDIGLPDLYDYDYSSYGIGLWGTMALGSWGGGGKIPVHLSAWSKMKLGWMQPTIVTESQSLELASSSSSPTVLKIPIGSVFSKEYFLVENRQKSGFDQSIPDDGILIWHVNENRNNNNDEISKLVDVIEASPNKDLDKPFNSHRPVYTHTFKLGAKTEFSGDTQPSSKDQEGNPTGIEIKVTSASGNIMTLDIVRPTIPNPGGNVTELDYDAYTDGQFWYFMINNGFEPNVLFNPGQNANLYELKTNLFFPGSSSSGTDFRFVVYSAVKNASGLSRGKVLYESKSITAPIDAFTRFATVSHLVNDGAGIQVPGEYFVAIVPQGRSGLAITATGPGSAHSYNTSAGSLAPEALYNYVIRASTVLPGNANSGKLLADNSDPLVKKLYQADILTDQKRYSQAVLLYRQVLTGMKKDKYRYQQYIAPAVTSLGVLAYRIKNYNYALDAFILGLQMAKEAKAQEQESFLYENIGETYYFLEDYQNAKDHILKAYELKKQIELEEELLVDSIVWLGRAEKKLGNQREAEKYLKQGLALAEKLNDQEHIDMASQELK